MMRSLDEIIGGESTFAAALEVRSLLQVTVPYQGAAIFDGNSAASRGEPFRSRGVIRTRGEAFDLA